MELQNLLWSRRSSILINLLIALFAMYLGIHLLNVQNKYLNLRKLPLYLNLVSKDIICIVGNKPCTRDIPLEGNITSPPVTTPSSEGVQVPPSSQANQSPCEFSPLSPPLVLCQSLNMWTRLVKSEAFSNSPHRTVLSLDLNTRWMMRDFKL